MLSSCSTYQPSPVTPRSPTRNVMLIASQAVTHSPARSIALDLSRHRRRFVRILPCLSQVAQRHEAAHGRNLSEVVWRRRRRGRPLERVALPRIIAGDLAAVPAADYVDEEEQHRESDQERRHGVDLGGRRLIKKKVGCDTSRHSFQTER